ncbi:hypothetical protein ACFUJ0_30645 [Streptomyces sp. NPDC057242]|uniref:hypothetical protein n=1 Tax=Streptomyces sp. NPDC057242 TaxID=3346063 RepID=UPI00362D2B80
MAPAAFDAVPRRWSEGEGAEGPDALIERTSEVLAPSPDSVTPWTAPRRRGRIRRRTP